MALTHGSEGTVVFTGDADIFEEVDSHVFQFTLNLTNDEYPSDTFASDSEGHSTYMGMYTISGSCQGHLDGTNNILAASFAPGVATASLVLTASDGITYTFNARPFNFGYAVNKQTGLNALTWDFKGSGSVAFSGA